MDHPLFNAFLMMVWFFLWVIWLFLLIRIIVDLIRSHDLGGWAKAGWALLLLVLPYVGVLAYLIVRGRTMGERDQVAGRRSEGAFRSYIRQAAGSAGTAEDLTKLADLKDRGALSQAEYERAKAQLLMSADKT